MPKLVASCRTTRNGWNGSKKILPVPKYWMHAQVCVEFLLLNHRWIALSATRPVNAIYRISATNMVKRVRAMSSSAAHLKNTISVLIYNYT